MMDKIQLQMHIETITYKLHVIRLMMLAVINLSLSSRTAQLNIFTNEVVIYTRVLTQRSSPFPYFFKSFSFLLA